MKYAGRTVIVTGGGHGIGKAVARMYAGEGAAVAIGEIDKVRGAAVEQDLLDQGVRVRFFPTDVSRPEDISALIAGTCREFGRIDLMICNVGIGISASPYALKVDDWDLVLNTTLRGAFLCARGAARIMREQGDGGAIVTIASTRALMSEPHTEAYAAAKGGVIALTHALACSLAPDRIRVNCVSPGWIETGDYLTLRREDHAQHFSGRVGRPEDIARACLFLTDPENDFITGENLVVDGGMTRKMIYL